MTPCYYILNTPPVIVWINDEEAEIIVELARLRSLGKWGYGDFFFEVKIAPVFERAQLKEETAASAMTIYQHQTEVGASSVFNMLERFGGLPVIYTVCECIVFLLSCVTQNSSKLILQHRPLHQLISHSVYFPLYFLTYLTLLYFPLPSPHLSIYSIYHPPRTIARTRSQYAISPLCRWLGRYPFFPSPNNERFAHIRPNISPIYPISQSTRQVCRLQRWTKEETRPRFRRRSDVGSLDIGPPYQSWSHSVRSPLFAFTEWRIKKESISLISFWNM